MDTIPKVLPATAVTLLAKLAARSSVADFYLAGSAALVAHLAHRPAHGLDLMSADNKLSSPHRRDLLGDLLQIEPGFAVETARDGFLYLRATCGTGVRFYYYPYPRLASGDRLVGFDVCSLLDLALMKLGAVISRGTKRDFVDLCAICNVLPLSDILGRSAEKFGHVRDFPLQALKGLADLEQADADPMPPLLDDFSAALSWERVVAWVENEVRAVARRQVGLADRPRTTKSSAP